MDHLFPFRLLGSTSSRLTLYSLVAELAILNAILLIIYTAAIALTIKAVF